MVFGDFMNFRVWGVYVFFVFMVLWYIEFLLFGGFLCNLIFFFFYHFFRNLVLNLLGFSYFGGFICFCGMWVCCFFGFWPGGIELFGD